MSLSKKVQIPDKKYFSDKFIRVIEDHLEILRTGVTVLTIDGGTSQKFKNNFYGLMNYLNVAPKYRHTVMRVNKIRNPKLCGQLTTVYIPDYKKIESLVTTIELAERDLF